MQNAARLLIKTVNDCQGVMGQSVTLVNEDDQTDAAIGVTAMTKLAEVDRVAAVVGAASSSVSSAAVSIAVRNQVVQISPASTSPIFTERARKGELQGFWFRTAPPDTFQGKALAKFVYQSGVRRGAILAVNNDYGNGLAATFVAAFKALGGQMVNKQQITRYDPKSNSFDSEVRAVTAAQPDAVVLVAYPETGSLILKAAFELGLFSQTPWIATDGLRDTKLAQLVGKDPQGRYVVAGLKGTAVHPSGQGFQAFRDRFLQAYGTEPTIYDPNTWDATALTVLAAESARATTGVAIRDHLRVVANPPGIVVTDICQGLEQLRQGKEINYQGASGTVDFTAEGDVTGRYDIWQIQTNGAIKVIDAIDLQP
jgi:branched-chain amino acid transport system substrate-binding protein/neutral amino acid transport system substrate-binding protein